MTGSEPAVSSELVETCGHQNTNVIFTCVATSAKNKQDNGPAQPHETGTWKIIHAIPTPQDV